MEASAHPVLAILLPALGACVVAVLATVVVERLGGVAGGILSTVPTTIVPAAIGLHGSAADDDAFRCAMCFVPVGILLNAGYLLLWRIIPARIGMRSHRHLLATTVALSLGAWLAAATAAVWIHHAYAPDAGQSLAIGLAAFAAGAMLGIAANRVPHPAPAGRRPVGAAVLALRGLAAGGAIAVALVLARGGDPIAGGIASVFPAIFTAIMVATWLAQGAQVPTGAVGPMMLGTLSVSAFALLASAAIPRLGVAAGAAVCWIIAVACINVPAYAWLRWVRARHERRAAAGTGAP